MKDLHYDPSGQYGCPGRTGEALPYGATLDVAKLLLTLSRLNLRLCLLD